jgi:hypothetical protein
MEIKMKCFLCHKEIDPQSNYFEFLERNEGKDVHRDYAHKKCWDKFKDRLNGADASLKQSNILLQGMTKHLRKIGVIPDEEVEIC